MALFIYDKEKSKLVVYRSNDDFSAEKVTNLTKSRLTQNSNYEEYDNLDYNCISESKVKTR